MFAYCGIERDGEEEDEKQPGRASEYCKESEFLPTKDEFYFEVIYHGEGTVDTSRVYMRADGVFKEQEEWTSFTVRLPLDADPEGDVRLRGVLQCYYPDAFIAIEPQYEVT